MTAAAFDRDRWLRLLRGEQSRPAPAAFVCFPHAGGSASYFAEFARLAPPWVDVWAVQYPGRQDRRAEPLLDNEPALTAAIVRAMTPWRAVPTAFFGHSMGAVLAFEVARRSSVAPVRLFASGRRAPSSFRPEEQIHLTDDAGLVNELRAMGGPNTRLLDDLEIRAMVLPAVRNDYRLIERYRGAADARVDCPITVLVGEDDPRTSRAEADAWAAHTTAGAETVVFPGGHFYLEGRWSRVGEELFKRLEPYVGLAGRQ